MNKIMHYVEGAERSYQTRSSKGMASPIVRATKSDLNSRQQSVAVFNFDAGDGFWGSAVCCGALPTA